MARAFVGRSIAEALLAAGHRVSVFNRGVSHDELPCGVERLRGDREAGTSGLNALAGRTWDACIDVSGYTPRQVRPSAELLRDRVGRYVFTSAVSVYGDPVDRPVVENHAAHCAGRRVGHGSRRRDIRALKVACENLVQDIYGDRATLLRPQVIVGPHDTWNRYTYWIRRAARGGEMLAPGDGSDHVQFIDIRDLARFATTVIEQDLSGAFNLAGPRFTWKEFIDMLTVAHIVWVPAEIIHRAGVSEFELPLFRPERGRRSGLMDVSNDRAELPA